MTAYNQQEYIGQAIEGVLNQRTSFPIELFIGDDHSTDGTSEICRNYASKFPDIIKYNLRETNIGMMSNFVETLRSCDGKYIAICEGDDYWTDETKLQQQAEFLEANPHVSLCCHNHAVLKKGLLRQANPGIEGEVSILGGEDYLINPFFHTASYFFRNAAQPAPYPEWYRNVLLAGDHFLVLFLSLKGQIGYINKTMSVFRVHKKSYSSTRDLLNMKHDYMVNLARFDAFSGSKFRTTIDTVIKKWNLVYHVYEPVGYFSRIGFLFRNVRFLVSNYRYVGGVKVLFRYFLPASLAGKIRNRIS